MDLMDYRRKHIANSPHLMSAEGAIATFPDGADLPLKSLLVDIDPVQSGSGDPSPTNIRPISGWDAVKVTRIGKNLLDDVTPTVVNAYISNLNGVPILRANAENRTVIVQIKENTTYTYTWNRSAKAGASADDSNIILFDEYPVADVTLGYSTGGNMNSTNNKRTFNSEGYKYAAIKIANTSRSNFEETLSASMLEVGSTATPYEPYNGVTVTIDLGQTVYGGTLNPLTGVLMAYPYYASYNGETLTGEWISDRDKYVSGTTPTIGAQVVDMSGTGTEIQLTPHQIRSLYGNNTIFADTGNVALEYWAHQ